MWVVLPTPRGVSVHGRHATGGTDTVVPVVAGDGDSQSAERDAERAIATIFLAARAGQLLLSAFMVVTQRHRVKHPKVHAALLAAGILESAWLGYRLSRAGGYRDRTVLWADTLGSAAGLVACEALLSADDGAPWMKNLLIGAAVGASGAERRSERIAAMTVLGVSELWSGIRARGRDRHVAGYAMAASDVSNLIGLHVTSRIYVSMRRRFAVLMDQATALRMDQATAVSTETERARQHRQLHRATVEVLNAIGVSTDHESAVRLAQQEAGRLRHILRTKGQVPSKLDSALFEVCEEVRQRGLTVELVTAELAHEVGPDAVTAARDVLHRALLAALNTGNADRAVVRATSETAEVRITVRDHGVGYVPGQGSAYEEHLTCLEEILNPAMGSIELWSIEDGGVRVALRLPARAPSPDEGVADQTTQSLPNYGFWRSPEGDDHNIAGKRHVHRAIHRDVVRAAKHQIGRLGAVDNFHVRGIRQSLQTSPQQRPSSHDVSSRPRTHALTMPDGGRDFVVRTTPFSHGHAKAASEEELYAEQMIQATFLVNRAFGLATGLAAVIGGRQHFRSARVAVVQFGLSVSESLWLGRQMRSRSEWPSPRTSAFDVGAVCATLTLGRLNTPPEDRSTWINWAPWSLATNAIAGLAMAREGTNPATIEAASIIGICAGAALSSDFPEFVANSAGMAAFFIGGSVIAYQTRQSLLRLREANEAAIQEGVRLAATRERARQLRYLHDGALQTLEAVGSRRYTGLESMQAYASREASHLLGELNSERPGEGSLMESLTTIVQDQARQGLKVDLQMSRVAEPPASVAVAFRDAAIEALTNVRKHANIDRALLRLESLSDVIVITVQDFGSGFDPGTKAGFGTVESIARRMTEVGGWSEIRSRPGEGTQVILWGPK